MDNRRKDYRHVFPPPARLRAELASAAAHPVPLHGEVADLSIGGMALVFREGTEMLPLAPANTWTIRFSLTPEAKPLWLTASLLHRRTAPERIYGFHFLPLADPTAQEDRDRVIWRFLLDEQRKLRNVKS